MAPRQGQTERDFARELAPLLSRAEAVFVSGLYAARAIQMENSRVPIVFDGVADAVGLCLVDSLRRPGRNATGYMHALVDEEAKLLETLVQRVPGDSEGCRAAFRSQREPYDVQSRRPGLERHFSRLRVG